MAQQTINLGAVANDGTGDTLRVGGDKINDNFTELYTGLTGLLDFKGSTDCSANPNYPAASKGDYYLVSVAGKIGGASGIVVTAGDSYFALADNAGGTQAGVGTSWTVIQGNINFTPVNIAGDTMTGDLIVPDEAYDATNWNGSLEVPTKNAVRDKIEAVVAGSGSVSDTVYGAGWNGDATTAPSKNAVYDKIEAIVAGGGYTPGGTDVALADGGTGASLSDPNADRILFWDDSGSAVTWLAPVGLAIIGTTISPIVVGCMAIKAADETTANYSSLTAIPWTSESYDTDAFHDNASNNTRLTIPDLSGTYGLKAKKVSLRGYVSISSITANEPISLTINKNGAAGSGLPFINHASPATSIGIEAVAHNIPVTGDGTDYFELSLDAGADTSVTIVSNRSCFQVWVTEWQA